MNILLGVTGGISAYKAADIIGALRYRNVSYTKVVMTQRAKDFITPLTLASLSHHPVYDDSTEWEPHGRIDHVELADWADLFIVAPATANTISKLARGIADNLLTSIYMAYVSRNKPFVICPAMNNYMYENSITADNLDILSKRYEHHIVGPVEGSLACGDFGMGKLAPTKEIIETIERLLCLKNC